MGKLFLIAMLSAATALASTQSFAGPVKRIIPQGKDGDFYYYQVKCENQTEGTVTIQDKENNVCAQAFRGERVCSAAWTVQKAAEKACK